MLPIYQTSGSAAADLAAGKYEYGAIEPGESALIDTGANWQDITHGNPHVCGLVLPRSGLANKHGVTVLNAPGLIDPDYEGTIKVLLINHGFSDFYYREGDRIAQLILVPFARSLDLEISAAVRDRGGFGSTGE